MILIIAHYTINWVLNHPDTVTYAVTAFICEKTAAVNVEISAFESK
jgi:hypothetical protein